MHAEEFKTKVLPLSGSLYRFAKSFLNTSVDAEDCVQDIFLKLGVRRRYMNLPIAFIITLSINLAKRIQIALMIMRMLLGFLNLLLVMRPSNSITLPTLNTWGRNNIHRWKNSMTSMEMGTSMTLVMYRFHKSKMGKRSDRQPPPIQRRCTEALTISESEFETRLYAYIESAYLDNKSSKK